jgi:hypothetical protein
LHQEDAMTEKLKYASIAVACVLPLALALTFGSAATSGNATTNAASLTSPARTPVTTTSNVPRTIALPVGTRIDVRIDQTITSRTAAGTAFAATVSDPVMIDGRTVIPSGARATGRVVDSKPSGRLKGVARLDLALHTVTVDGTSYPIHTSAYGRTGRNHKRRNWTLIGGGTGAGALIGGVAAGPAGLLIGSGAGAGAGTIVSAVTGRKDIVLPAETRIAFALKEPTEVAWK